MSERLRSIVDSLGISPGDRRFEVIFAVRVGLFHREPDRARGIAERRLAPGGTIQAFHDGPATAGDRPRGGRDPR
jgi:hypothetical protein